MVPVVGKVAISEIILRGRPSSSSFFSRLAVSLAIIPALFSSCGEVSRDEGAKPSIYPCEREPGDVPELFAPGLVSTDRYELNGVFTPGGGEFYFTRRETDGRYTIMTMALGVDGRWGEPSAAPFSGRYSDGDPFVTPDGSRIFFISTRPREEPGPPHDIWFVDRTEGGWSKPVDPGYPLNTPVNETHPAVTALGEVYYATRLYGGRGGRDIYSARFEDGSFLRPQLVGEPVSTVHDEGDPFISADGKYIVFFSAGRPDSRGGSDLYVSYIGDGGEWGEARNLGEGINGPGNEFSPSVTPDGRYLFFTRDGDIYWVSAKVLDTPR